MIWGDRWLRVVEQAAHRFGTPLYLYDPAAIEQRLVQLRQALGSRFAIRYAVKTNPNPHLLRWLHGRVESLDVSSAGELRHALRCGWSPAELEFTGPAKTEADLELAVTCDLRSIVVEDEEELGMLDAIADRVGRTARVLLRIAPSTMEPGFAVRLAGRPSQFGIDEERVPSLLGEFDAWPRLRLAGFHVYSGTQCLDDEALARHFTAMWRTFRSAAEQSPAPVDEFVFGAGAGIPYHDGDGELTLQALGPAASTIAAEMDAVAPGARPYVELGRYLVGEAGLFVTRVVRTKASRGLDFLLCDGGMNHNLGACGHLGGVSHRHYPIRNLSASERSPERTYRVVGPLCTAIDTLALRIELPTTNAGDLLGVGCSGAYGPTASPLFFISHAAPREVWWNEGAEPELLDTSWLPELSPTGEGRP